MASNPKVPVTVELLNAVLERTSRAVSAEINKRLAPLATRIAVVETRTGALSMLYGKGSDATRIEELDALITRSKSALGADAVQRDLLQRLDVLTERIATLEARPEVRYVGTWQAGVKYSPGNLLTHAGSIWHANAVTTSRPGTDSTFTLAVKHGRDAR